MLASPRVGPTRQLPGRPERSEDGQCCGPTRPDPPAFRLQTQPRRSESIGWVVGSCVAWLQAGWPSERGEGSPTRHRLRGCILRGRSRLAVESLDAFQSNGADTAWSVSQAQRVVASQGGGVTSDTAAAGLERITAFEGCRKERFNDGTRRSVACSGATGDSEVHQPVKHEEPESAPRTRTRRDTAVARLGECSPVSSPSAVMAGFLRRRISSRQHGRSHR